MRFGEKETRDIIGVDEAGRGPWAGPVCFAAVSLGSVDDELIKTLKDSKVLTKKRRESVFARLQSSSAKIGVAWCSARTIDDLGLTKCSIIGMSRAVSEIFNPSLRIVVDGNINFLEKIYDDSEAVIKADATYPAVSAASIVAKVLRDRYMKQCALRFAGFGFDRHAGYGTSAHRQALDQYGATILHRLSFRPVSEYTSVN